MRVVPSELLRKSAVSAASLQELSDYEMFVYTWYLNFASSENMNMSAIESAVYELVGWIKEVQYLSVTGKTKIAFTKKN